MLLGYGERWTLKNPSAVQGKAQCSLPQKVWPVILQSVPVLAQGSLLNELPRTAEPP